MARHAPTENVSPAQNIFEGEFSPLAEGRTDLSHYGSAMRYMKNMVPCRVGPGIGRSGTFFESKCFEPANPSKLLPFEYNEDETLILEFGHYTLRFHYEYSGIAAYREVVVTNIVTRTPFTFDAAGHTFQIGDHITFTGFAGALNVNGVIAAVTNVAGNRVTTDYNADVDTTPLTPSAVAALVYELTTIWPREDVQNLRIVQYLNTCYLLCTKTDGSADYRPYYITRWGTFDWHLRIVPFHDGPYLDINDEDTYLIPTGRGTWLPDMTGPTAPSGTAAASSEVPGHEAWRAFDDDIDSYWEGNSSQEGWLEYQFENGFVNILPNFAGASSGGMTISASSQVAGFEHWRASDGDMDTDWRSNGNVPQEWRIDFNAAQTVLVYTIRASNTHEEYAPVDWTLDGSNTGTGGPWTNVDTRTGMAFDSGQKRQFTVQSPASFRYYRINVTKVQRRYETTIIKATGTPGTKGYVPRKTVTTQTANKASFAQVMFSIGAGTPKVVDGYTIYLGRYAKGEEVKSHAPRTWYFEGYDGTNWDLLDSQQGYDTWPQYRSEYFPLQNAEAYKKYRLRIKNCGKAGDINPRVGKLVMSSPDAPPLQLRATSKVGINDDKGFVSTDVGRLIRLRDADNVWRWATIASVVDATHITLNLPSDDPLVLEKRIKFWRLGLWSDTTGWPICGTLHEDRLWLSGAMGFPDHVVGSEQGNYFRYRQVSNMDVVFDNAAIVARCNTKYMSRVVWLKAAEEALRIGTGKAEYILSAPTDEALSARNFKIRQTTKRGSSIHEPAAIDSDVIFLQKSQRQLYVQAFAAGQSGVAAAYKANQISQLGAHLLEPRVVQIVYQQEPHAVVWGRRTDGSVVAMTYAEDSEVFGGHRHDFGGAVMDLCALPSPTDRQDSLWMVVKRRISGVDVYYIERLYRFWDFADTLPDNATFMDSSLRYYGLSPTDKVYGLRHLEGQFLSVLADNIVYKNVGPVTGGTLQLERPATTIVVGIPYVIEGEIVTPELGAADGTAQGKSKRPHSVVLRLWQSARGEVGRWNEDQGIVEYTPVEYNYPLDATIPEITLRTCLTATTVLPAGYGTLGTVRFRQTDPLPFNIVGLYPQSYVEDER